MTLQEQHRLAALAAGIEADQCGEDGAWIALPSEVEKDQRKLEWWAPLHCDHDAFGLLVAMNPLGIDLSLSGEGVLGMVVAWADAMPTRDRERVRVATFNLAVEIGKRMERE